MDLSNVSMSHYRLSKIRQQDIKLQEDAEDYKLEPSNDLGAAKPRDKKEEFLSQIIERLNDVFITDNLTDKDMLNYAYTVRDKLAENEIVMKQIAANNTPEQVMLGDFPKAMDDAILESSAAHQEQMMQLLSDPAKASMFARVILDMLNGQSMSAR